MPVLTIACYVFFVSSPRPDHMAVKAVFMLEKFDHTSPTRRDHLFHDLV
jgi:hypothetical protein